MKYLIKVTQDDIDKGMKTLPEFCPISLAAKRDCEFLFVSTGIETITFGNTKFHTKYKFQLPESAIDFVRFYDGNTIVHPFEFELNDNLLIESEDER